MESGKGVRGMVISKIEMRFVQASRDEEAEINFLFLGLGRKMKNLQEVCGQKNTFPGRVKSS